MGDEFHGDARVEWEDARDANLANWEDRVPIHTGAYGLDNYRLNPRYTNPEIPGDAAMIARHFGREDASLEGLDLVHLQCHIGTDSLSLARMGATVTGLDFSPSALEAAEDLARECGASIRWVCSDVMEAAAAVGETFDVVYTSVGTISWLADLDRWAAQVAGLLRPGGVFFIRDAHPALFSLDDSGEEAAPRVKYRYFPNGAAESFDEEGTYLGEGTVAHTRTYNFPHSLAEVVTALLGAGLRITGFEEGQELSWQYSPLMEQLPSGAWVWPEALRDRIPCTFTLTATH